MKRLIFFIVTAFTLSFPSTIQGKTFDFDKLADMEGVRSVHISKAMFKILSGIAFSNDDINLQNVMHKLESLQIITCEKAETIPLLIKEAEVFSTQEGYEELMRVKEEDSHTIILQKLHKNKPNEYVLVNIEKEKDFRLILMNGTLTLDELQQIIGKE